MLPSSAIATEVGGALAEPETPTLMVAGGTPPTERVPANAAETAMGFLAALDTLVVRVQGPARIVVDARRGTLVAGGDVPVGPAMVQHRGVTLEIGAFTAAGADSMSGLVHLPARASVRDVAAGLHAAGVEAEDMAAIFEALHAAGALRAEVVVR